jgi:hypothetical protein
VFKMLVIFGKCSAFLQLFLTVYSDTIKNGNSKILLNPSAWGHLIPSSYCDVGRFPAGYLNFELNCA